MVDQRIITYGAAPVIMAALSVISYIFFAASYFILKDTRTTFTVRVMWRLCLCDLLQMATLLLYLTPIYNGSDAGCKAIEFLYRSFYLLQFFYSVILSRYLYEWLVKQQPKEGTTSGKYFIYTSNVVILISMGMAASVLTDLVGLKSTDSGQRCIVNEDLVKYLFLLPFFIAMVFNLFVLLRVFNFLHTRLVNARRIRDVSNVVESEREAELITKQSELRLFTSIILAFGFVKIPYAIFRIAYTVGADQFPYPDNSLNILWCIGSTISFSQGFLLVLIVSKIYHLYDRLRDVMSHRKTSDPVDQRSTSPITDHDIEHQTNSLPPPVGHDNNLDSLKSSDSDDGNEIPIQDMLTTTTKS